MSHTTIIIHSRAATVFSQLEGAAPTAKEPRISGSISYTPEHSETPQQVGAQVAKILKMMEKMEEDSV